MFCDLPKDIKEKIFDNLDIFDRTRLNMALPKHSKMCHKNRSSENKLGVVTKAIKKKYITKPSPQVRNFFSTIDHSDPTTLLINEIIPSIVFKNKEIDHVSIEKDQLKEIIKNADRATFEKMRANPLLGDIDIQKSLMQTCLIYNPALFDYIASNNLIDKEYARSHIKYYCTIDDCLNVIIKHFVLSDTEVKDMYTACILEMSTKCANILDGMMRSRDVVA